MITDLLALNSISKFLFFLCDCYMLSTKSARFISNRSISSFKSTSTTTLLRTAFNSTASISPFNPLSCNSQSTKTRQFSSCKSANMPMPKDIIKGGKENLTVSSHRVAFMRFLVRERVEMGNGSSLTLKISQKECWNIPAFLLFFPLWNKVPSINQRHRLGKQSHLGIKSNSLLTFLSCPPLGPPTRFSFFSSKTNLCSSLKLTSMENG